MLRPIAPPATAPPTVATCGRGRARSGCDQPADDRACDSPADAVWIGRALTHFDVLADNAAAVVEAAPVIVGAIGLRVRRGCDQSQRKAGQGGVDTHVEPPWMGARGAPVGRRASHRRRESSVKRNRVGQVAVIATAAGPLRRRRRPRPPARPRHPPEGSSEPREERRSKPSSWTVLLATAPRVVALPTRSDTEPRAPREARRGFFLLMKTVAQRADETSAPPPRRAAHDAGPRSGRGHRGRLEVWLPDRACELRDDVTLPISAPVPLRTPPGAPKVRERSAASTFSPASIGRA